MPSNVSQLPTGTITFLFTDIEGSTKLVQALGDAYHEILNEHHRLLREVFDRHRGVEIGTEGDAFFVVFESPYDAVEAALDAQRALLGHEWGHGARVKVRMGLHTGRGVVVGDNYGGLDVHRASRIASAAHGEQVIISDTTRALIEPTLKDGVQLKRLGRHRLKDLDHTEELFQLCAEGLPADLPPPRTPESHPNNLPAQLTPLVGRTRELVDIKQALDRSRLVTLVGPGGTGKTRLAIETAIQQLSDFADGAYIVFLAPVSDAVLVPSTIAKALGAVERGSVQAEEALTSYLGDREMLLVLDNFEQVLDAAALVPRLLMAAPKTKVISTSRAPLRVDGEREYFVPPMSVPDADRMPSLERLIGYEAVDLFVQRAVAANHGFTLNENNAEDVARLCVELDGLPLAIELAAARTRLLSPAEMLKRLSSGLSVLGGGGRDRPSRQQTLRNAIAWSYELLDDPTRAYFRRLGVFVGGCSIEQAQEICDPEGELGTDAFDAIDALVENSLLRPVHSDAEEPRFRFLRTIRDFSVGAMEEAGETGLLTARHADHYIALARTLGERVTSDETVPARLSLDHDNLRKAMRTLLDGGRAPEAAETAASLWRFWAIHGHFSEAKRWLREILAAPELQAPSLARARAMSSLGSITYWQNEFDETAVRYKEALRLFSELGHAPGIAEAAYNVAFVYLIEGDLEEARSCFEQARKQYVDVEDRRGQAQAEWGLAMTALGRNDMDEALKLADSSLEIFQASDDWFGESLSRFVLVQVARAEGDLETLHDEMKRGLSLSLRVGDVTGTTTTLAIAGEVAIVEGEVQKGLRLMSAAAAINKSVGGAAPAPLVNLSDPRELAAGKLSQEEIEVAMEEGTLLSLEEACAIALGEAETPV